MIHSRILLQSPIDQIHTDRSLRNTPHRTISHMNIPVSLSIQTHVHILLSLKISAHIGQQRTLALVFKYFFNLLESFTGIGSLVRYFTLSTPSLLFSDPTLSSLLVLTLFLRLLDLLSLISRKQPK
jgi:hypothetical protein